MGDYTDTADALRTKLQDFTALPLYFENGEQPDIAAAPSGFVYSEVHGFVGRQLCLGFTDGARESRDEGELEIWVCVPRGSRAGAAESYAEQIRALFQPNNVTGVTINERTIGRGRESGAANGPNGRVWAVPVIIKWHADRVE